MYCIKSQTESNCETNCWYKSLHQHIEQSIPIYSIKQPTNLLRSEAALLLRRLLLVVLLIIQFVWWAEKRSPLWAFLHAHHRSSCFHQLSSKISNIISDLWHNNTHKIEPKLSQIENFNSWFVMAQVWYTTKLLPLTQTQLKSCLIFLVPQFDAKPSCSLFNTNRLNHVCFYSIDLTWNNFLFLIFLTEQAKTITISTTTITRTKTVHSFNPKQSFQQKGYKIKTKQRKKITSKTKISIPKEEHVHVVPTIVVKVKTSRLHGRSLTLSFSLRWERFYNNVKALFAVCFVCVCVFFLSLCLTSSNFENQKRCDLCLWMD